MSSIVFSTDDGKEVVCQSCGNNCIDRSQGKSKRKHFHCPKCSKIVTRATNFKVHLRICFELSEDTELHRYTACMRNKKNKVIGTSPSDRALLPSYVGEKSPSNSDFAVIPSQKGILQLFFGGKGSDQSDSSSKPVREEGSTTYQCKYCNVKLRYYSSLRDHIEKVHSRLPHVLPSICLDKRNGIFAVAKNKFGPIFPIHVQKHVQQELLSCTSSVCEDFMQASALLNPSIECRHLEAVQNAQILTNKDMHLEHLGKLFSASVISREGVYDCEKLHAACSNDHVPLVVYLNFEDFGYDCIKAHYSVFTNKESYYCMLKRTIVSFEQSAGIWLCECPDNKPAISCIHKSVVMWYMCEHQPALFAEIKNRLADSVLIGKNANATEIYSPKHLSKAESVPQIMDQEVVCTLPLATTEGVPPSYHTPLAKPLKRNTTSYVFDCTDVAKIEEITDDFTYNFNATTGEISSYNLEKSQARRQSNRMSDSKITINGDSFHSYNLLAHRERHCNVKKLYKCDYCQKTFSRSSVLTRHRRVHTFEKPYKCGVCEKAFSSSSNLSRHKKTHKGKKK